MFLYSHTITPRLQYIADFISKENLDESLQITSDAEVFDQFDGPKINYSNQRISKNEFWIKPHTLLFERVVLPQNIQCFEVNEQKAFFKTEGDHPFDIFAAVFFLISRYEEYLPHQKDMYGRYAHQNSLAYKESFLHLPLINLWLEDFKKSLKRKLPSLKLQTSNFKLLPTYDIDEAFCYRNKSWWKTCGGYARSIIHGRWGEIKERRNVLKGQQEDPYDSFSRIKDLHTKYHHLGAYVFILVAEKNSRYDKNILPFKKPLQEVIRKFFEKEPAWVKTPKPILHTGLHPSWQSGDNPTLIKKELDLLQYIIGVELQGSRQHYIRFTLPATFRHLLDAGIRNDYSMGYGSINGFRASVASSFYWYDLEKNKKTSLELHPFCYMDANSFFEQKYTPQQALEEMLQYFNIIKSVNGTMITIWHNTFLGTHKRFAEWREVYEEFISKIYHQIPAVGSK